LGGEEMERNFFLDRASEPLCRAEVLDGAVQTFVGTQGSIQAPRATASV
jgi:hypothetical protein